MIRALLVALTLSAACGSAKPRPPLDDSDFDADTDGPAERPTEGDSVPVWAGKMSARVPLIAGRDLPPAVVKALVALLPPPEALAPNRLLWARPLADQAGLLAFAAERGSGRGGTREAVIIHGLASHADGAFTLVASFDENRAGGVGPQRELDARDADGDGVLDLFVDRDLRQGDLGQRGLAIFHSATRTIALVIYRESANGVVVTPQYVCAGGIGVDRAVVVVTRTAAEVDDTLIADRIPNVWLPDDKGRFQPTPVWGHELAAADDPVRLLPAWRKAAAAPSAAPEAAIDEDGRLTAVPDCGPGLPLILGNAVRQADGKRGIPRPLHLIGNLTRDQATAESSAAGKRVVMLPTAQLD